MDCINIMFFPYKMNNMQNINNLHIVNFTCILHKTCKACIYRSLQKGRVTLACLKGKQTVCKKGGRK